MSQPPLRFCATPGCAARVPKGHCAAHAQMREQGRPNFDVRRLYRTRRWIRLRASVLQEQPFCVDCSKLNRLEPSTDVDHVRPHRGNVNLFWDSTNLQALCHACHSKKTERGE